MDTTTKDTTEVTEEQVDPIWTSNKTARQIYALSEVERDISRLLSLAGSAISLLTLPQMDEAESNLPQGEERSEQFALEVGHYFQKVDVIQESIRSGLAHIRQSRISPAVINAPALGFVTQPSGVGSLSTAENNVNGQSGHVPPRGLQAERINRDAWKDVADALQRLKEAREREENSMQTEP